MIFDLLAPPKGPRGWAKKCRCTPHSCKQHIHQIWLDDLRGDSVTDGRTDGQTNRGDCNILIAIFKKGRG